MISYKSDKQVREHLAKFTGKQHKAPMHEAKESKGFEAAEHRLGKKKIGIGAMMKGYGK